MRGTYVRACNECVDEMVGSGQDGLLLHEADRKGWMGMVGERRHWLMTENEVACRCYDCRKESENGRGLWWVRNVGPIRDLEMNVPTEKA
jgi:hypothetical protein